MLQSIPMKSIILFAGAAVIKDKAYANKQPISTKVLTNFRTVPTKDGKVAGMAHPLLEEYNCAKIEDVVTVLKTSGFSHLVSLDKRFHEQISSAWNETSLFHIEDFTPPTLDQYLFIYDIVRDNKNVVFHCDEGYGRSGTVMASIVLRHLLLKKFQGHNPRQPIPYPKKNTRIFLGEHSSIPHIMTTPLVAAAIRTVRTSDSQVQQVVLHNGKVIRTRSTEGASIENPKQVQSLMELEQHLILGSNIINGVSQARSRL